MNTDPGDERGRGALRRHVVRGHALADAPYRARIAVEVVENGTPGIPAGRAVFAGVERQQPR
ncbi:hypothetical protein ACWDT6_03275 [Nocardia grenadensis]